MRPGPGFPPGRPRCGPAARSPVRPSGPAVRPTPGSPRVSRPGRRACLPWQWAPPGGATADGPIGGHQKSTGFIFNRIWAAIKREALEVVAEGVSTPQDVDEMWKINTGAPAGPFRMMDQVGLDVVLDIEKHYAAENPALPTGPRELLEKYVDAGHLGVKTGQGFYTYSHQG
ncbi:3-hydroxyacyl-CoA dehydrogenase family protein [Streptomyces sp. NPDC001852]|uniref:3-hydroxyacyl-CoA dehydrogenase family protein n=1 Tax=Streptomyces sp. NPDC001852 TaxID=3364619 RepID=UPI0036BA6DBD